ncbi:MAG: hypothetical protein ACK559_00170, partial [bacterium]
PVTARDAPGAKPGKARKADDREKQVAHRQRVLRAQRQGEGAHEHRGTAPHQHGGRQGENSAGFGIVHE